RIDTPLLFPSKRGKRIDLDTFRRTVWKTAIEAAGVPYQRLYDMRHTYATDMIAAGVDLFTLSRRMGTSLKMIDQTYGHLAADTVARELQLLDAYDARRTHG